MSNCSINIKLIKIYLAAVIFVSVFIPKAESTVNYMTLSTSSARRTALAAPATLKGYVAESPLNPAGFSLFSDAYQPRFEFFFNPMGAFIAAKGLQEGPEADGVLNSQDVLLPLLILVKGFSVSYSAFNAGIVLGEQLQSDVAGKTNFEYFPLFDDYYNRLFLQFELHEKIALGFSAELFSKKYKVESVGISYGVMIKPGKMSVGVFYYMLPERNQYDFLPIDRVAEETVNAGLSWEPTKIFKCFVDLRNVSEENSPAFLEPHLGIETTPWIHTSLRAGFYKEEGVDNAFMLGLGFCNLNYFRDLDDRSRQKEYLFDYDLSLMPNNLTMHALSMHLRL